MLSRRVFKDKLGARVFNCERERTTSGAPFCKIIKPARRISFCSIVSRVANSFRCGIGSSLSGSLSHKLPSNHTVRRSIPARTFGWDKSLSRFQHSVAIGHPREHPRGRQGRTIRQRVTRARDIKAQRSWLNRSLVYDVLSFRLRRSLPLTSRHSAFTQQSPRVGCRLRRRGKILLLFFFCLLKFHYSREIRVSIRHIHRSHG